jgi:hypothetical protein
MIKESITKKELVDFLNSILEVDNNCLTELFNKLAICNNDLSHHPTIQVSQLKKWNGNYIETYGITALGLINGIFGIDKEGNGAIYREIDSTTGKIIKFGLTKE